MDGFIPIFIHPVELSGRRDIERFYSNPIYLEEGRIYKKLLKAELFAILFV